MEFRNHKINRTCNKKFTDYKKYKSFLAEDFSHRCGYCNLRDSDVTSNFEIDHFVPKAEFSKSPEFAYLVNDYNNLVYSCRNCNSAKSDIFCGNLNNDPYDNRRFYDPAKIDYNQIFYRDVHGTIASHDLKGKSMIIDLKLYRPIHNLAWICEQLDELTTRLDHAIQLEPECEKKNLLKDAHYELLKYYKICKEIFVANYKGISISDIIKDL